MGIEHRSFKTLLPSASCPLPFLAILEEVRGKAMAESVAGDLFDCF
jgi:hypothetical protein